MLNFAKIAVVSTADLQKLSDYDKKVFLFNHADEFVSAGIW